MLNIMTLESQGRCKILVQLVENKNMNTNHFFQENSMKTRLFENGKDEVVCIAH